MQVELDNFLSILATGAFDVPLEVQPMSRFKWQRLMAYASQEEVELFVTYGIQRSIYGSDILEPSQKKSTEEIFDRKRRLYARFENRPKPLTQFSNIALRLKMNKIFNEEVHKMDTQMPMLALLDMIANFLKEAFMGRLSFAAIINIGLYLRQRGHKVDFNTLDEYIDKLHLNKTANLIGTILVRVFDFSKDEIQFLKADDEDYMKLIEHYFNLSLNDFITQRQKKRSGTNLTLGIHDHSRISAQRGKYYAKYHRQEALSSYFSNLVKSITQVEE